MASSWEGTSKHKGIFAKLGIKDPSALGRPMPNIEAAEAAFQPYVPPVVELLQGPLMAAEEGAVTIRGRALECMGHIALGVGKDNFAPFLALAFQSAEQGLQVSTPFILGLFALSLLFVSHSCCILSCLDPPTRESHLLSTRCITCVPASAPAPAPGLTARR